MLDKHPLKICYNEFCRINPYIILCQEDVAYSQEFMSQTHKAYSKL